jgi:two-component system response regulator NreC
MSAVATVVLADDHPVVRQGLRKLLEAEPGITVVGEAADGIRAVELVSQLRPDVLVIDLIMGGLSGLDAIRQVSKRFSKTRIVMFSMHSCEAYVLEALRNGALAYVLKDSGAAELIRAIRDVLMGRRFLSSPLSDKAIETYLRKAAEATADPYESLSSREREVFHLAAEGLSNPAIAERLHISPRTVETHRSRVLAKLGVRGQTELIRYALQRGVISLETTNSSNLPGSSTKV